MVCLVGQTFLLKVAHILSDKSWSGGLSSYEVCIVSLSNKSVCSLLTKQVMQEVPTCTVTTKNHLFSALQRCFSQLHSMYMWQHSSLTPSPSAILYMVINTCLSKFNQKQSLCKYFQFCIFMQTQAFSNLKKKT